MPTPKPGSRGISRKAIDQIIQRKTTEVIAECGCITVPYAITGLLGDTGKDVLCDTHGWVRIVRRATFREIAGLPEQLELPDIPPF